MNKQRNEGGFWNKGFLSRFQSTVYSLTPLIAVVSNLSILMLNYCDRLIGFFDIFLWDWNFGCVLPFGFMSHKVLVNRKQNVLPNIPDGVLKFGVRKAFKSSKDCECLSAGV